MIRFQQEPYLMTCLVIKCTLCVVQQKLVESRETAEEEVVWAIVDELATEGFSEIDNTGSSQ